MTFTFDAVSYAGNIQVMLMLRSEIFSYNAEIWDRQIREGETYVTYAPNYQDIIDKAEELMNDKVAKIEAKEQATRIGPTSWILDRSTTPWTIRFDNGCTLQFPDFEKTETVYGYGYTSSLTGTEFVTYPLPPNIIRAANGGITVEKFKKATNLDFGHILPGLVTQFARVQTLTGKMLMVIPGQKMKRMAESLFSLELCTSWEFGMQMMLSALAL